MFFKGGFCVSGTKMKKIKNKLAPRERLQADARTPVRLVQQRLYLLR